jgi:hypothetical protein
LIGTVDKENLSIVIGYNSITLPLESIKRTLDILNESMIG